MIGRMFGSGKRLQKSLLIRVSGESIYLSLLLDSAMTALIPYRTTRNPTQ